MYSRFSRLAVGALIGAAVVLVPSLSWAVFHALGPSSNEWGVKYDVEVHGTSGDDLNVAFTLSDAGRLKPIYSITVVAFSKPHADGGRSYLVKKRLKLKTTKDGRLVGQVQIPKTHANIAKFRILTLTVDGRRQTAGAAYYDIPLKKFLNKAPVATTSRKPTSIAAPPMSKVVK